MKHPCQSQKGFTMVEMMAVTLIISILAAMLLPVYAKARAKALTTFCQGKLQKIYGGLALFEADQGFYPKHIYPTNTSVSGEPTFLPDYLDDQEGLLWCPATDGFFNDPTPVYSYGTFWFKRIGSPAGGVLFTPPRVAIKPESIPMYADSDLPTIGNPYILFNMFQPNYLLITGILEHWCDFDGNGAIGFLDLVLWQGSSFMMDTRHSESANVLYLDGHLESDDDQMAGKVY